MTQQWLAKRYLIYRTVTNMWFFSAVWLYFYRIFITDQQVGILDATAFAIGLVAEIPSGALADKFGRARLVRIGQVMIAGGILVQAFGSSFLPFVAGQSVMMIGFAFISGADDALFFEKLNYKRISREWRKLVTRGSQVALIATLFATLLGGWLHTINPRLPWVLTGAAFLVATAFIWNIKDTRTERTKQPFGEEVEDYLNNIAVGFKQFLVPGLRLYVPLILTVQGLFYASGYGILRIILLDRFHFSPLWGSVVVASTSIITVGLLSYMHRNAERLSERRVIGIIALSAAASLLLATANIGYWGYVVILVLYAGEYVLQPFMSEILNNHAPDEQRATVLSVASFLKSLPYVLLAPTIGALNTQGNLSYFLFIWPLLILGALMFYLTHLKRNSKASIAAAMQL